MFKPSNSVAPAVTMHATIQLPEVTPDMAVYFRRDSGQLGQMNVQTTDPKDAILTVKEELVAKREGWNAPVLAVVQGGKKPVSISFHDKGGK